MAAIYPKVTFLVADLIRLETGGKVTIAGLYSGDLLRIEDDLPKELPEGMAALALSGLSILMILKGGEGHFPVSLIIERPSGKTLGLGGAVTELTLEKGRAHNFVVPVIPFPIFEFGEHVLKLKLGKKTYRYTFLIQHRDPTVQLPKSSESASAKMKPPKKAVSRKPRRRAPAR